MLPVSQDFLDNMIASSRKTYGKIKFKILDVDASDDVTITVTDIEPISNINNINNELDGVAKNYATFETDRWMLDGSMTLIPDDGPYDDIGWWSNILSDSNKLITPNISITCQFINNVHSTIGLTILFDTTNDEWAEEFDIKYYNESNVLIDTISVTNNLLSFYVSETPITDFKKIEIVIKKWSLPIRRARVEEVVFGIVNIYDNDNGLVSFKVLEEVDLLSSRVTTNELSFTIDNSKSKYNILNPDGIYTYLQEQQKIEAYLGSMVNGVIEYIPLGEFFLIEWQTDKKKLEATFIGYDKIVLLDKEYNTSIYGLITLYDLAIDILTIAGLTSEDYYIDPLLSSISTTAYLPICTCKEALRYVAVAGQCLFYCDRTNTIQLKRYIPNSSGLTIDFDNAYTSPEITLSKPVKNVIVDVNNYIIDSSSSECFKGDITVSGTQDVLINYNSPSSDVLATVSGGTLNSAIYYTNTALLNITASGTVSITANGKKINTYASPNTLITGSQDGIDLSTKNPLITTVALANSTAQWIKDDSLMRKLLKSPWRSNPALELVDSVSMQNQFETTPNVIVTRQEYSYNGALKGLTEGRL